MLQELFRIPGLGTPIYGYGLMLVLGFLGALALARFLARRSRIDPEIFVNCAIIALGFGVAGARLSHVLENLGTYTNPNRSVGENLLDAVNIRSGGLTFYGGFLLATAACIAYGLYKGMPIRRGMDIVAPCLMIGLGVGRVGCFLNGCCEGGQCDLPAPLAVQFPYHTNPYLKQFADGTLDPSRQPPPEAVAFAEDGRTPVVLGKDQIAARLASDPARRDKVLAEVSTLRSNKVHPAQLYSTITALLLALFLTAYYTLPHAPGRVFALMLMAEAPTRFLLEMLRAEPPIVGPGSVNHTLTWLPNLSFSMVLSAWLFLIGAVLWYAFRGRPDDMTEPKVPAGARLAGA
jgi:phosphatidylglycerol:prolipoprotein diacylglycerol transferase